MSISAALTQSRKTGTSRKAVSVHSRPQLDPLKNYSVPEAALTMGVSPITVWRAIYSENLKHYRVGRRVLVSGQHLLDWRDAGGRTGHGATTEAA
jgi:excisionase family DNA binding protein